MSLTRSSVPAIAFFFLTACNDHLGDPASLTNPSRRSTMRDPDTRFGAAATDRWIRLSPEQRDEARRTAQRAGPLDPPPAAVAITDVELPDGAVAWIIRDSGYAEGAVLLFSRASITEDAFLRAGVALTEDVRRTAHVQGSRILRLDAGGSVIDPANRIVGRIEHRTPAPADDPGLLLARLTSLARSRSTVEVPGIGKASLLHF